MIYYFVFCTILTVAIKCDYYDYYGMNDGYNDYYSYGGGDPWGLVGGLRQMSGPPPMNMPPPFAPPGIGGGYPGPSPAPDQSIDGGYPGPSLPPAPEKTIGGDYPGSRLPPAPEGEIPSMPGQGLDNMQQEGGEGTCQFGEEKAHEWTHYDQVFCSCEEDGKSVRCYDTMTYNKWSEGEDPVQYFKSHVGNGNFETVWPRTDGSQSGLICQAQEGGGANGLDKLDCNIQDSGGPGRCNGPDERIDSWDDKSRIYPMYLRICVRCQCLHDGSPDCKQEICHIGEPVFYCDWEKEPFTMDFNEMSEAQCECNAPNAPPRCVLRKKTDYPRDKVDDILVVRDEDTRGGAPPGYTTEGHNRMLLFAPMYY